MKKKKEKEEKMVPYTEWRRNFAANTIGPDARLARQVVVKRYMRLKEVMAC